MRKIVFDIETRNDWNEVGVNDPSKLDLSLLGAYDYETDEYSSYLLEDLPKFFALVERADMLIGFNSDHFDIRVLTKYYPGNLKNIKSLDLMKEVRAAIGRRVSLDQIAEATIGRGKSGHGMQAVTWWKQGDIENLRKYCLEDVKITKEIYEFARKHNQLKFREGGKDNLIPLSTSGWEEKQETAMTFSLPF